MRLCILGFGAAVPDQDGDTLGERLKQPVAPQMSRLGVFIQQRMKPLFVVRNPNITHKLMLVLI